MTIPLSERARRLVVVELDRDLAERLKTDSRLSGVKIHQGDILDHPLPYWVDPDPEERFLLVGNLPYQITSPVLFACLDSFCEIERAILMMQREVAERLVAGPGSRTYGVISVLTALFARPELVFTVGGGAFNPPPRVESAVVKIEMLSTPLCNIGEPGSPSASWVKRVVKAAFAQRRKMLKNSLAAGLTHLGLAELDKLATAAGIDLRRRAETLTPEEFITLASVLPAPPGV